MPLSVEDKFTIQETVARYCHAISERNADAVAELFTKDGVLEIGWSNTSTTTHLEGRKAIRDWWLDVAHYLVALRYMRHWTSNFVIDGDGDRASVSCFFLAVGKDGSPMAGGTYKCRLRRTEGTWRIEYFHSTVDGSREETAAREALLVARLHSAPDSQRSPQ